MTKNPTCKIGIALTWVFFKVSGEQSEDDHCCTTDECCLGEGECGSDCCNEDGAKGHCFCGEEPTRTKKQEKDWEKAYFAMSKHKSKCKACIGDKNG